MFRPYTRSSSIRVSYKENVAVPVVVLVLDFVYKFCAII
jgi:hypothetical protein